MFQVDMCFICEQPSLDVSIAILWSGGLGLFNRDNPEFVIAHPCDRLIPGLHRNARSSVVRLHTHDILVHAMNMRNSSTLFKDIQDIHLQKRST